MSDIKNPMTNPQRPRDKIGENTKDYLTLKLKAEDNEARWQAVCEDLERRLKIATEALETLSLVGMDIDYTFAREALEKIK